MRLLITAAATLALTGCAQTKYKSTTTHPDGTVTEWGGKLTGNYGLVPSSSKRGNLCDGGRGGLLGAILPDQLTPLREKMGDAFCHALAHGLLYSLSATS